MGPVKEKWQAMTGAERIEATKESLKELAEAQENKQTAQHQAPLALLGDARKTLAHIEDQVSISPPGR